MAPWWIVIPIVLCYCAYIIYDYKKHDEILAANLKKRNEEIDEFDKNYPIMYELSQNKEYDKVKQIMDEAKNAQKLTLYNLYTKFFWDNGMAKRIK